MKGGQGIEGNPGIAEPGSALPKPQALEPPATIPQSLKTSTNHVNECLLAFSTSILNKRRRNIANFDSYIPEYIYTYLFPSTPFQPFASVLFYCIIIVFFFIFPQFSRKTLYSVVCTLMMFIRQVVKWSFILLIYLFFVSRTRTYI